MFSRFRLSLALCGGFANLRSAGRTNASVPTQAQSSIFLGGELYGDLLYDFYIEAFEGGYSSWVIG
jgi:hypothetical protein